MKLKNQIGIVIYSILQEVKYYRVNQKGYKKINELKKSIYRS